MNKIIKGSVAAISSKCIHMCYEACNSIETLSSICHIGRSTRKVLNEQAMYITAYDYNIVIYDYQSARAIDAEYYTLEFHYYSKELYEYMCVYLKIATCDFDHLSQVSEMKIPLFVNYTDVNYFINEVYDSMCVIRDIPQYIGENPGDISSD